VEWRVKSSNLRLDWLRVLGCVVVLSAASAAATPRAEAASAARALITEKISESDTVTLAGNTRPEANAANDRGPVAADFAMDHMLLQLRRPEEREHAFEKYLDELEDRKSPNFHHWLTAQQIGDRYGLAPQDVNTITAWLKSRGFTFTQVYPNGVLIDFSGTASDVDQAFHTDIHNLEVNGKMHFANMSDPQIPAAIAPAVVGVVSLNDFRPQPQYTRQPNYTLSCEGGTCYAVAPPDLATIYNLNPLFSAGITGQGQTVVVIEDTDVDNANDWNTFRSNYGLADYTSGSFTQIHPGGTGSGCADPGVVSGAETEAILDAEWASAAAPNATIKLASCQDTATYGELLAMENLVNGPTPYPQVISNSYGTAETLEGAAVNAAINSVYQSAVGEGISVFVASGDSAAAYADQGYVRGEYPAETVASRGITVNGAASTPYNVAVGGTDFADTYDGTNATYWNTTNGSGDSSAKSYIPEIPWNDSCASSLTVGYYDNLGYDFTIDGSSSLCNGKYFLDISGGSGGPSGCATGTPSTSGVVSGTCAGYAKPAWQSVLGNPKDGVRDLPDLSLFASNGPWGHSYVVCDSSEGGCVSGWGGTSFAAPIMAGIQALIDQDTGDRQGNPNPTYYSLAAAEYGSNGSSTCDSTQGNEVSGSCIFYDVTLGDNDVPCTGSVDCYNTGGTYGVLSTSSNAFDPAYKATTGWDFATGIGTVNANNLVTAFNGGSPTPTPVGTPTPTSTPTRTPTPTATPTPTPVPVALKFAPKKVTFPKVEVGATSKPKKITLSNPAKKGGPSITLKSFAFSANFGYFSSGTTCVTGIVTLAPKEKCTIEAGFRPAGSGKETGTLTIQDNASNRPQTIELSGTGK
jgi:subtilase family serine protease